MTSDSVSNSEYRRNGSECLLASDGHIPRRLGKDCGLEERASQGVPFATDGHSGTAGDRVRDVFLDLGDGRLVDERTLVDAVLEPVAHGECCDLGIEPLDECVVDSRLDVEPVGTHARLSGITELRSDCTGHCCFEIGIVEYDDRRIASELHRHLLDGPGALGHQFLADLGGAGEAEGADLWDS